MNLNEMSTVQADDDVLSRVESALFPETPAEETPKKPEAVEEPTKEISEEVTEEETEEVEDSEEETEDEEESEEDSESEEEEFLEVSQVAQVLGIDESNLTVSEDGDLLFTTNVDGETGTVKLDDLLKSYQTDRHVTNKSKALADAKREFEEQRDQQSEQLKNQITEAAAVTQTLESQLTMEYQSIDWNQLRVDNPAEWTAKRQEFQDRVQQIHTAKAKVQSIIQEKALEAEAERTEKYQAYLAEEAQALTAAIPNWADPKTAEKELGDLGSFISDTYGFDPKDIEMVENHRLILLARDAMAYRSGMQKADIAKKKITKLPKLQRPGVQKRETAADASKQAEHKRKTRLKKTGSVKDLAAILEARL